MFILTEATPNPEALKFIPHARLTDGDTFSFERDGFDAARSALAVRLFELEGVRRVFIAPDFLTISREPGGPGWDRLRPQAITALADHLVSGEAAVAEAGDEAARAGEDVDEVEEDIRQVLGLLVGPGVASHGGEVLFDRFDAGTGVLWIRMRGACGGCPSSRLTLKASVERLVRSHVPEVLRVEETREQAPRPSVADMLKRSVEAFAGRGEPRPRTLFTHAGRELKPGSARNGGG